MINTVIFPIAMFIVYNYLVFELIDAFLKMPRLKKVYRIPVGLVNTLIATALTTFNTSTSFTTYIVIGIVLFVEFLLFYRDKYSCSLFCMLACVIHIMAMRSLCVTFFAIALHCTIYDIVNTPVLLNVSTGTTFMLQDMVIFLVIKFVPAKSVRIINQHSEQLSFMVAWLSIFCTYLLINSQIYSTPMDHSILLINQIVAPIAILIGTYIVLFFSIKTGELLGYKEKTEELQHTMEKERQYRITIDKDVFRIIEVNFNTNELISGFEDYEDQLGNTIHDYNKMITFMIQTSVHFEDRE